MASKRGKAHIFAAFLTCGSLAASPVFAQVSASGQSIQPASNVATAQAGSEASAIGEALALADRWIEARKAYAHIPGLSAAIVQGDRMLWSKGYGTIDAAGKVPATPQTIYSICSISKLFTSIALMQQVEQKRVRLDEPVDTYLPWTRLDQVDPDSGPITLRAILSHSAGLPRESDFPYWTAPDFTFPTREQLRERLSQQSTLFGAGRYYQYSNLGLTLAGETVATVTKTSYADYVQKNILTPLALKDTRTYLPMDLYGKRLAVGFSAVDRDGKRTLLNSFDARGLTPAAGFTSTAEDLAKFAIWHFKLLRNGGKDVLKASTLREMQRPQFVDPEFNSIWGLGYSIWRSNDQTFVGHNGECPGYRTFLSMHPASETAVVIMHNGAEDSRPFARGVFAIMAKRKAFQSSKPTFQPTRSLNDYVGRYSEQPWEPEGTVVRWGDDIAYLTLPTDDPAGSLRIFTPSGNDAFRRVRDNGSLAEEIMFERDSAGRVTGMKYFSNSVAKLPEL